MIAESAGDLLPFPPDAIRAVQRLRLSHVSIAVAPEVPLVITEGNYLLYNEGPWAALAPLLTEAWYVEPDEEVRLDRLVRRHIDHGKTEAEAIAWSHGTDQANAALIAATRSRATLIVPG